MDLLLLFNESVVLGDTTERKLVHQVDLIWRVHVLVLEALHHNWEGGTEKHDLSVFGMKSKKLLHNWGKLGRQKLIGLVHDKGLASREISHALACKIQNPAWCSNNDMNWLAQSDDIVLQSCPTCRDHDVDTQVLSQHLAYLRGLEGEFSGGDEDKSLCLGALRVYALECGDDEGGSLSGAVLRSRQDVSAGQSHWDRFFLDRRRLLEPSFEDAHHELALDEEVLKLKAFCCGDILCRVSLHATSYWLPLPAYLCLWPRIFGGRCQSVFPMGACQGCGIAAVAVSVIHRELRAVNAPQIGRR